MTEKKAKEKKLKAKKEKPNKKWITWGIGAISIMALVSFILIFPRSMSQDLFIEYFSLLFSIPGAIIIVGLVLLLGFKDPITFAIRERNWRWRTKSGHTLDLLSQSDKKIIEQDEIKKEVDKKEASLRVNYAIEMAWFERTIRYVYRSQYRFLLILKESPQHTARINWYYLEYLQFGGNTNYSSNAFIEWLISFAGFVSLDIKEGTHTITEIGKRFLSYCEFMKYSDLEFRTI